MPLYSVERSVCLTPKITGNFSNNGQIDGIRQAELQEQTSEETLVFAEKSDSDSQAVLDTVTVSDGAAASGQPQAPRKRAFHSFFKNLELDSAGKIDMSQFSVDRLKQKYSGKKVTFTVNKSENGSVNIIVKDAVTGRVIEEVSKEQFGAQAEYTATRYNAKGKKASAVTVTNGVIDANQEFNPDGSSVKLHYEKGDMSKIGFKEEFLSEGGKVITYFSDSEKESEHIYDPSGNYVIGYMYSGGFPYVSVNADEDVMDNYLLDDLKTDFSASNTDADKLYKDIKLRITGKNIVDFIDDYAERGNRHLLDDIRNSNVLSDIQKIELTGYLSNLMDGVTEDDESQNKLKTELMTDIIKNDFVSFKKHLMSISSDDILFVVQSFGFYPTDEDITGKRSSQILPDIIRNSNMSDADKKQCLTYITDKLREDMKNQKIYSDDIYADISKHLDSPDLYRIDFKRMISRANVSPSDDPVSVPDGKVTMNFRQGGIGDCWLIAGLKTMLKKPWGKEFVDSMLSVNSEKKIVTVTFSDDKKYDITFDEVAKATHLAEGNGNIRAIEIAMDRFIRDRAYAAYDDSPVLLSDFDEDVQDEISTRLMTDEDLIVPKPSDYIFEDVNDIVGDGAWRLFKQFLGNGVSNDLDVDYKTENFNNPDKLYTFAISGGILKAVDTVTKEVVTIETEHEYSVFGSDAGNIYIHDPRTYGDITLRVRRADLNDDMAMFDTAVRKKKT